MNISLGCGREEEVGWRGVDIEDFGWNKVADLTKDQIPFGESRAEFIKAHNFLEHIPRSSWKHFFNECWRVLQPEGILEIITPDAAADLTMALCDPTHVSLVVKGTFTQYLTGERPRNATYGFKPWKVIEVRNFVEKEPRDIFARLRPNK